MTRWMALDSIAWYGEGDEPTEFTARAPTDYRQYRIAGTLRVVSPAEAVIDTIVITDKNTRAVVTLTGEAGSIANLPESLKPDDVARLWRDAGYLAGWVKASGGRPSQAADRLADYRSAILALGRDKGYRPGQITARLVLLRLHRTGSEAQLRKDVAPHDIGGWRAFRAEVLRGQ